ncbi:unnamed protein product [Rotaria magnacalcarata]|uniref:Uncharacterized protein n=1 Tax=Rotaria magnacalcarata TaxID=392030 RepID=A0A816R7X5_9BILA|nr:unnamed protein product [Rotaria magnacalcarata]
MLFYTSLFVTLLCLTVALTVNKNSTDIIYLDNVRQNYKSISSAHPHQYYFKYQPNSIFVLNVPSKIFTQVPGLSLSFHHVRPRLYKISYHGQCSVDSGTRNWVRMMVDGRILISNRLYPNTEQRLDYDPSVSTDMSTFLDSRGGALYYSTGVTDFPSSKVETVYLSAGIHTIEVVARTDRGFRIHNGELHVELIEFEPSEVINLPLLV